MEWQSEMITRKACVACYKKFISEVEPLKGFLESSCSSHSELFIMYDFDVLDCCAYLVLVIIFR
jgi:hypothetical protein